MVNFILGGIVGMGGLLYWMASDSKVFSFFLGLMEQIGQSHLCF